jgi:hypothetical protein
MQEQGSGRGICHSAIAFTMDLNRIWGELKGDSRLNWLNSPNSSTCAGPRPILAKGRLDATFREMLRVDRLSNVQNTKIRKSSWDTLNWHIRCQSGVFSVLASVLQQSLNILQPQNGRLIGNIVWSGQVGKCMVHRSKDIFSARPFWNKMLALGLYVMHISRVGVAQ